MENIVLCGSMKVKNKIIEISKKLEEKGYNVLLPIECMNGEEKSIASRTHFDRIINPKNKILLIINETKNGIKNYIGPNSLAEISCGFYFNKKIYILNDIYEPYEDELIGWGVTALNGNIDEIKSN